MNQNKETTAKLAAGMLKDMLRNMYDEVKTPWYLRWKYGKTRLVPKRNYLSDIEIGTVYKIKKPKRYVV